MSRPGAIVVAVGACVVGVLSCDFAWDAFDPRLAETTTAPTGGAGGELATGGAGGRATGGGGAGGMLTCPAGTADCDGDITNGCEADLRAVESCGACGVVCTDRPCGTTLMDTFDVAPADWTFNGDASYHESAGAIRLTTPNNSRRGSAFFNRPIVVDDFVTTFEARIDQSVSGGTGGGPPTQASPGDGMAFAIQTTGPDQVGDGGGGLGLGGLSGYAFELDTFPNDSSTCDDPDHQHIGISGLDTCPDSDDALVSFATSGPLDDALQESGWRVVTVTLSSGMATVALDGDVLVGPTALAGFVPGIPHYFGFGAGTGFYVNRHGVRTVTITFPTPRCL